MHHPPSLNRVELRWYVPQRIFNVILPYLSFTQPEENLNLWLIYLVYFYYFFSFLRWENRSYVQHKSSFVQINELLQELSTYSYN